mmetsp:Transcript_37263/g.100820  ORF Transcript_37263/g.100820 Transcript_37263/m.100820 type:complete len:207 (-) Transcript_37263:1061-1681(-)
MPCQLATRGRAAATPRRARRGHRRALPGSILGRSSGTSTSGSRTTRSLMCKRTTRTLSSILMTLITLSSTSSTALLLWTSQSFSTTSSSPGAPRGLTPGWRACGCPSPRRTARSPWAASPAGLPAPSSGTCPAMRACPSAWGQASWRSASMCTTRTGTSTRTLCRRTGSASTTRRPSESTRSTAPRSSASALTTTWWSLRIRSATL